MKNIAIFASGSGSNAENIVRYFAGHPEIKTSMMISDRKHAFVFERMSSLHIPSYYMNKTDFENGTVLKLLYENKIDYIILAGFLKLLPSEIIQDFPLRILNIHPALLPSYGGKGMYGMHVHEAVVRNGEKKTGITIHYVNENFDEGEIIHQVEMNVESGASAQKIAEGIHELEMNYFPQVIEKVILNGR